MLDRINYTQTHRDDLMVLMIRRTQQEVAVMEALAVIYTHTTRTKLADTLNAASVPSETGKPFSAADMTPIIKLLDRKGLAVWDGTKVACCGEIVEMLTRRMIAQGRFEPISQAVCEIYPVGLERLQWRMESPEDILRAFRIALYQNDVDFAFKLLDAMDAARVDFGLNAYHTICCNPFDAEWFANMHPVLQAEALLEIIVERSDYLEPLGDYLQRAEAILVEGQPEGFIPLRFVYAQTQILCGQWASACETASGLDQKNGTILAAWMDFLVGNNEQAIRGFEAAIKLIRKETGRRNIYISGPQGIAFILALVKDGRPKSLTRAAQLVKFARNEPGQWFALAYEILERVVKLRSGDPDGLLHGGYACWSASDTQHPMTILLREMLTYWQGDKICDLKRLGELHSGATAGGYRWLAAEAGELMSRMDAKSSDLGSQAAEFRAETRTVSICETATRQEPWLRALEAMAQIGEIAPGGGPSKRTERLIWRIVMKDNNTVERIQPVLQKSTLKGWTRGRKVAIKRLHEESASLEYLTDHDRKVCGAIQVEYDSDGYSYYGPREVFAFDTCKALLALVGHPQVFWDQGDTQIDVVSSRPELQVLQNDKSLHVSLTPSMTNRHGQTLDFVATQESPTRLAVITFSPEHRRIAALVGPDGIDVPNRGKDVLLKAIAAASASVTVQSDIGVGHEHEHVENIEPCPTPHVQLYPYGDGLKAAIAVRPFGDRGPYYSAKSGGQTVLAEVDGKRLQTTRDFVSEAKGVADLRLACDTLDRFDDLGGEYFSTDIEVCLQLLLELGQLGGQGIVEWPQG
ncbi:MAG: hypothetical protein HN350_17855, partial [Phycisphaerales bacterium]|nr:hypothetical protein [Phycisphaerales bacterium]